ncbi:probable purine permease 10 [Humulus lupulus]|uniref:probable purine permease 10 n=1 Tax=Humulus lupulus TaxID=3486 RepID=UPI002B40CD5B|nr:probable purine permease 10 [Humulus lupulus]
MVCEGSSSFDMEEVQEIQFNIKAQEANKGDSHSYENESNQPNSPQTRRFALWIRIGIYSFLALFGQAAATLLGRLYYERGGKSQWLATLVQLAGFPILLPYYFFPNKKCKTKTNHNTATTTHTIQSNKPSTLLVASLYLVLGLIVAANSFLASVGLMYLPVSTYSIISVSQLAFNAFFSFFLNSQKFTPYIINSLVLLTISSVLLVFEPNSEESSKVSKGKYATGLVCTVCDSVGSGLVFSLTQFLMKKVLKKKSFSVIVDVIVFQSLVASVAILVGLFASSDWATLREEMNEFELGKVSYVMTLSWTIITWQLFFIGTMGLILEVSSLFSNALSVLGLPIVPVLAVFFFHEKMDGIKVMSMVLAIWGFVSYAYQNYLDNHSSKNDNPISNSQNNASPEKEIND